jgi:hypothetical protein
VSHSVAAAGTVLLGDAAVEWQYDSLVAGQAESFRLRARASGRAGAIHVYISAKSTASKLIAGLYTSAGADPARLLSIGSSTDPTPGAWTTVPIAPVELVLGRTYWLAILGEGGRLRYRDRASGSCPSETSARRNLGSLPFSWQTGTAYSDCPASAYITPVAPPAPAAGALPASALIDDPTLFEAPPVLASFAAPVATAPPTISGSAIKGQVLSASNGSWTGSPTSYAYQWEDCNAVGEACSSIGAATSASYMLASGDVGHTVRVIVIASNAAGSTDTSSDPTATVTLPPPPPANSVPPAVSGVAEQGQTLTASTGQWTASPTSYAYRWEDCNTAGEGCSGIDGATSSSYELVSTDVGHRIRVLVSASNAGGSANASSEATGTVVAEKAPANKALPKITGTAKEGQALHASEGSWTGSPTSYGYQWEDCNTSGESCVEVSGATSSSYELVSSDVGDTMRVVVTARNAGGSTPATSAQTATVVAGSVPGPQIYVAQSGAGSQSGEGSCSNAHPLSWLDSAGNWGAGNGKVAPGMTVDLCGTLTEPVEVLGNGLAGEPVTIRFTAGAKIAMGGYGCPATGCINLGDNREYVTINGGSDGVVENTNRGTKKERNGAPTKGVYGTSAKHIAVENLEIANMYVAEEEDAIGNTEIQGISFYAGEPEYITIDHDVLHDMGWAINVEVNGSSNHVNIEYNTLYHDSHGISPTGGTEGGDVGPVIVAHNHFYANGNWSSTKDVNHIDGLHCYTGNGKTGGLHWGPAPKGLYIYDNTFTIEGEGVTAAFYIEGNTGPQCGDSTSNFWIFDNVLTARGNVVTLNNGLLSPYSGEEHIFNNTLIGNSNEKGGCVPLDGSSDTSANDQFKNNISTTCTTLIDAEKSHLATGGLNYNLYANGGSGNEAFACGVNKYYFSQFTTYQKCIEGDTHSIAASSAKLDLTEAVGELGELETGSPALDAGTNLTSLCPSTPEEALCKNIDGEPRPATGAWNIGAY